MTSKPSTVRLARPEDEDLLFSLIIAANDEWSLGAMSNEKIRGVIWSALNDPPPQRPVFGVIRGPRVIEGAIGMFPTEPWNSEEIYLRAFFHFVLPAYRKSRHAVELRDFGKWFSEFAGMPILFELPHLDQTEVKARMYERGTDWVGGMFVYRAPVVEEVAA